MTLLRIFQILFIVSFVGVYAILAISSFWLALQGLIAEGRQALRDRRSKVRRRSGRMRWSIPGRLPRLWHQRSSNQIRKASIGLKPFWRL